MDTVMYLLVELNEATREEFEEHFFGCKDCADEVRSGATFLEHSKVIFTQPAKDAVPVVGHAQPKRGFRSLGLAWACVAALLVVIGYQYLGTHRWGHAKPQVLPWAAVTVGTWGTQAPVITASRGSAFLLFIRIPADGSYRYYTADFLDASGKLEWSLTIPATSNVDQWPVQIPAANREAGVYTITVRGSTVSGESKDIGRTSFELQIQE
jgi:anti-sigma factor RsiW